VADKTSIPGLHVGTAGWSYEDWNGIVYPASPPRGFDRLAFLASLFDVNEVNSTFYRIPDERMTKAWAQRVAHNPRFAFTVKLFQGFTHARDAGEKEKTGFLRALRPLREADRLGAVLIQSPVSVRADAESRSWLQKLLRDLAGLPLAVEFRHRSWDRPDTVSWLAEQGAAFVNIDQPLIGENLRATNYTEGPLAYYRFHGRNAGEWFSRDTTVEKRYDYLYEGRELEPWVERIGESARKTPEKPTFAILNNHFRGQAVANAIQLRHGLTGETATVPGTLLQSYPALAPIAKAAPEAPARAAQRKLF
jgi:uncharacterized protein YecE (DUF72 family)